MRILNTATHLFTSNNTLLYIGFGILWSLTKGFMNSEVFLFPDKSIDANFTFFFYTGISTLITFAFMFSKAKKLKSIPIWVTALFVSFGLWLLDMSQILLSLLGSLLCAIGMTWLFVQWFRLFAHNSKTPFLDIPIAFLVGNIISWLYVLLGTKSDSILYVIGIFASALLAQSVAVQSHLNSELVNQADTLEQKLFSKLGAALKPSATSVISFFAVSTISIAISYIALFQRDVSLTEQLWIHLIGPTLGALVALLIHRTFSFRVNASQISIFVIATLILFLPIFQSSYVNIFRLASMAIVEILFIQVVALSVKICQTRLNLSRAAGAVCWSVLSLSTFIGTSVGYICSQLSLDNALFYGSLGTLFGYFLITALVLLLPFSSKGKEERKSDVSPSNNSTPTSLVTSEDAKEKVFNNVAYQYGLTTREIEVLLLLVSGRSGTYIAKELVLSPETVKGHTRHIYQKLNVHSKQELIDWFQGIESHTASKIPQ